MKKIGFIGAYDKIDLILYIAKLLRALGKKIMIVDATILQKAKYIVPVVNPTTSYVTEFEELDVAVGFKDMDSIKEYLGMPLHAEFEYDYILYDIDSPSAFERFNIKDANKKYFVTAFDLYSLKRGLEILAGLKESVQITKVLFSKNAIKEEDEYLNYLALGYKILWSEERIYFPFDTNDQSVLMENQRVSKVKLKKLSTQYKESLMYITEDILEGQENNNLRKVFKQLEKGV